ncbi:hypothetical protein OPV22_032615 [Ensete ventricosum]|uniref:THH1/TOM1/TOM3 domain-containing protein n=1 Tax=Ensete ventricosum TaxID=4639 RepID=A0AAV8PZR2_ENSVE|nr:hypothetical protein OPV22_032615 [Ensete ventricosum]
MSPSSSVRPACSSVTSVLSKPTEHPSTVSSSPASSSRDTFVSQESSTTLPFDEMYCGPSPVDSILRRPRLGRHLLQEPRRCSMNLPRFLSISMVQVVRIQLRVPEYGWTTQKVFHFMNGVRAVVFGFHKNVFLFQPRVFTLLLLDLPGILFILFYLHAANKLRIIYIIVNCVIYVIEVCIWIYLWINDNRIVESIGSIFVAMLSFIAAVGFILYGGRLFCMLRFVVPVMTWSKHLKHFLVQARRVCSSANVAFVDVVQVGYVTAICFTCFLVRCCVVGLSAFDTDVSLDVLNHPILDLIYYTLTEILPSALVLYILRKLPPRRVSGQYYPI